MNVKEIKREISKLSSFEILEVLHDCEDLLAPISPAEMAERTGLSKKQILNRIELGKYMTFDFDNRKFPIVNDHIKASV